MDGNQWRFGETGARRWSRGSDGRAEARPQLETIPNNA